MAPLVPCSRCARHVRVSDVRCPFCDTAIGQEARERVVPSTNRRLDRWAFFTFATAVSVAACSSGGGGGLDDAGSGKADTGGAQPPYGTPRDDGGMQALYGAVPVDAALDTGGAQPPYGVPRDDGGMQALYGAVPADAALDSNGD